MNARILNEEHIALQEITDCVLAAGIARTLAEHGGFDPTAQCQLATVVSELSTNAVRYGGGGEIILRLLGLPDRVGFEVLALDSGPGIADIEAAMTDNYSTGNSLGLGLPGVKRLMDEFDVISAPNGGTRCTARKWR